MWGTACASTCLNAACADAGMADYTSRPENFQVGQPTVPQPEAFVSMVHAAVSCFAHVLPNGVSNIGFAFADASKRAVRGLQKAWTVGG